MPKNWCFWTEVLEKTLESSLNCEEIKPVNPKGNQCWIFIRRLMLKLKLQYFGHLMQRADSLEKTLMLGKIEGGRRRGRQDDRMVGWHHWVMDHHSLSNGHEFEQTQGDAEGQGSLVCCSPRGRQEPDKTEQLNNKELQNREQYLSSQRFTGTSWPYEPRQMQEQRILTPRSL